MPTDVDNRALEAMANRSADFVGFAPASPAASQATLEYLEAELNRVWRSGRNAIVGWRRIASGLEVMSVPQYLLPDLLSNYEHLLNGSSEMDPHSLMELSEACEIEPYRIGIPGANGADWIDASAVSRIVCRYSITRMSDKAMILFDIVGFSRLSPLEQVAAINNLSYSINIAHRRAREHGIDVAMSSTTTGDGFYVWSEDDGLEANLAMICILMLTLADNALGHEKGMSRTMPVIRTCFHIGSCYAFFQANGAGPGAGSFIVGESTIALARMMGAALPRQILVGNFITRAAGGTELSDSRDSLTTAAFMKLARDKLQQFADLRLAGERVTEIKCYLTGDALGSHKFQINQYMITDKHGFRHEVYNAKVNIHRRRGGAVYLGIPNTSLENFNAATKVTRRISTKCSPDEINEAVGGDNVRSLRKSAGKVLVVDDDPDVRAVTVAMIGTLGHQVFEAEHGPAAQQVMEGHPHIDLLVTDMVMPGGIGGLELAKYAIDRTPGIKVLLTTGYGADLARLGEYRATGIELLSKPYVEQELEEKVESLLRSPSGRTPQMGARRAV